MVKTWLAKTIHRNYLWDWILSRGRSFISAKVDHNPTFWYVCHPDAFKQLSLIQVEESSWAVLLSIFPTSFIPIFICCNSVHEQAVKWAPFHHGASRETKQRSRGKSRSSAWLQIRPFPGSHSTAHGAALALLHLLYCRARKCLAKEPTLVARTRCVLPCFVLLLTLILCSNPKHVSSGWAPSH